MSEADTDHHANTIVFVCDVGMANNPDRQYSGDFQAHGPAVVTGQMCASGTLTGEFHGTLEKPFDFSVVHHMTCADGTGGFAVTLRVKMYEPMHTYFEWELGAGFGHHASLGGRGSGVGTASRLGRDVIRDHLFGQLEPAN